MTACCLIPLRGYLLISLLNRPPISLSALDLPDTIARLLTCVWEREPERETEPKTNSVLSSGLPGLTHLLGCNQRGLPVSDRWMQSTFLWSSPRQRALVAERSFLIIQGGCRLSEQMDGVACKRLIMLCPSMGTVWELWWQESGLQPQINYILKILFLFF